MASRPNSLVEPSINTTVGCHRPPRVSVDRDRHERIDGGKVGRFEQAASLEKLAGVEATGNQRL